MIISLGGWVERMAIIQCSEHEFGLEFFFFFFQKLSSYKVRKIEKGKGNQEKLCTTFLSKKMRNREGGAVGL